MKPQNYASHSRYVPGFHFVLGFLLVSGLIISLINLFAEWHNTSIMVLTMPPLLFVCCILLFWFIRQFAVKVQDRAIRAEENLRYYILAGKAINSRVTMQQIIALRFAPDDEFLSLAEKAAAENLSPDDIKKAIVNWKADEHRV